MGGYTLCAVTETTFLQACGQFRRLQFAEGGRHGTLRGANGRGHAAEDTHDQSEEHAHPKKIKGDLEGEGQVGKSLKIHGAGGQDVEGQNGEAANEAANKRNQEGLKEK